MKVCTQHAQWKARTASSRRRTAPQAKRSRLETRHQRSEPSREREPHTKIIGNHDELYHCVNLSKRADVVERLVGLEVTNTRHGSPTENQLSFQDEDVRRQCARKGRRGNGGRNEKRQGTLYPQPAKSKRRRRRRSLSTAKEAALGAHIRDSLWRSRAG